MSTHTLVSTLGSKPQLVTRLLDWLLMSGYPIKQVVVIHTYYTGSQRALALLQDEFETNRFYSGIDLFGRLVLDDGGQPLGDLLTTADAKALLKTLTQQMNRAKQQSDVMHLNITGGRKTMAAYAMTAAQLLFRPNDRVWHMVAPEPLTEQSRQLHCEPGETQYVLEVPVLRWNDQAAAVALYTKDPWEMIERQTEWRQHEQAKRLQEFWQIYLTQTQREIAQLLVLEGLDNTTLGRHLNCSPKTIANHLTNIYHRFEKWQKLSQQADEITVTRAAFVALFGPWLRHAQAQAGSGKIFPV
jgi:CRISPR-associated protein Csx14